METAKSPRYYFDFRKERKAAAKGESAYTPATSLFAALGAALDFIRQMGNGDLVAGREALVNNAELAAEMTRAGALALGLKLFAAASPASALTADPVTGWNGLQRDRERISRIVCRSGGQRPRRDEGKTVSRRAHRLLRLPRHHRNFGCARARACQRDGKTDGVWRGGACGTGSVRA